MGASNWRPIKTAPRDELVLVFCPDADDLSTIMICSFMVSDEPGDEGGWYGQSDFSPQLDVEPTHWMPLPLRPEPGRA